MCRLFALHAGDRDVAADFWFLDAPDSIASPGWEDIESGELVHFGPDLVVDRETIVDGPPQHQMVLSHHAEKSQSYA